MVPRNKTVLTFPMQIGVRLQRTFMFRYKTLEGTPPQLAVSFVQQQQKTLPTVVGSTILNTITLYYPSRAKREERWNV